MNIPGLITIEYIETENTAINFYDYTSCTSSEFSSTFTEIEFVPTTGGFTSQLKKDEAGNLYHETTLQFFIAELSATQKTELDTLSRQPAVFRVTDPEGVKYILGTQNYPLKLQFTEQVDPTYTGRRGYSVTATSTGLNGPLVYSSWSLLLFNPPCVKLYNEMIMQWQTHLY